MKKRMATLLVLALLAALALPLAAFAETEQVFRYAVTDDPDSFDPGYTLNSFAGPVFYNCFVGLVRYNTDSELVPGAARAGTSAMTASSGRSTSTRA